MVIPHIGVVGKSDTGKTSLVVELINRLKSDKYKVASIKHTQGDFAIDSEGTDTFKHAEAGSELVVFSTQSETSFIVKDKLRLDEILSSIETLGSYDLVIIEGMKEADIPKVSSDKDIDLDVERDIFYDGNIKEVLDWVKEQVHIYEILNQLPELDCGECGFETCRNFAMAVSNDRRELSNCERKQQSGKKIELIVEGEKIELGKFPSKMLSNTLSGMLKSLKGVDDFDYLVIRLKK